MRSIIRSSYAAAPLLLGSTLVYALPRNGDRLIPRAFSFDGITAVTGSIPQPTPSQTTPAPTPTVEAAAVSSTSDTPAQAGVTNIPSQSSDTTNTWSITTTSGVLSNTNTWSITTTSGSLSNPAFSILNAPSSSTTATHGSLAPPPAVDTSQGVTGHGVLTGVVAGGLVIGLLCLTVGLWFCYRRRGPTSGASTPKYATKVVADDEKPRSAAFAFLRGGSLPWKKSHIRVRSSMSFASPILENEPKMVESNHSSVRSPLAPHLSGSTGTRADWNSNGRWSTFSTSDSSAYPQTPVGGHLSGIIMETVVETDAASDPRTPTMASRQNIDYLDMKRSSNEPMLPPSHYDLPYPPLTTRQ